MSNAHSALPPPPHPSSSTASFSVLSEAFVPLRVSDVWSLLAGPGHLPGDLLDSEPGQWIRFRQTGTAGWLPIDPPIGEYRVDPVAGGTRVLLVLTAEARVADSELVRKRLQAYVDGSVAARVAALRAALPRAA
jgi:hypothetical protein